jgi:hypothetical protein
MNHVGTVTKSSRLPNLPFHAQCSCGTAGTFPEKEQALQYLRGHGLNVQANNAANTFKLVDDSDKPEVLPNKPASHIPGVGNMPATHAALGSEVPAPSTSIAPKSSKPPAPPAPPNAKPNVLTSAHLEKSVEMAEKEFNPPPAKG